MDGVSRAAARSSPPVSKLCLRPDTASSALRARAADPKGGVADQAIIYGSLFAAIILHEVSHGVAALALGDDTARRAGRLTLNPIPHVDPFGSILLPLMGVLAQVPVIGWAKPVPINPAQLRQPRRHMLLVSLAGPATNLSLMAVSAVLARALVPDLSFRTGLFGQLGEPGLGERIFVAFAAVNLFLGVFNLLPIPPLDGSSIVERFLPADALPAWHRYRMYGFLVLFAVVFWTPVLDRIVNPLLSGLLNFIYG